MPTANLFLVTQTLQNLLNLNVRALLKRVGSPAPITLNVTAMPPERVGAETNTLNLHLYHVMEDPFSKNDPPPGAGPNAVSRQSLTLMLYYILTAHHQVNDVFDAEIQQLLFGLALKTFHDFPRLTDTLKITPDTGGPKLVMPSGLIGRDNRFDLAMRALTPEEALGFWHADDSATTRLSAYFEVRPVIIEPEAPTATRGTVFDIGLFVSAGQAPRIDAVAGLLQFEPPPATGIGPQSIETVPARATLSVAPVNRITLRGTALAGDGTRGSATIVLRSAHWQALATPVRAAPIDPLLNPGWAVTIGPNEASFEMQPKLTIKLGGAPAFDIETTPGIYIVSVETTRTALTRNGTPRTTRQESGQSSFSLGPRIESASVNVKKRVEVKTKNLFDLTAAGLDVLVAVDGEIYAELAAFTGVALTDRGHFVRSAGKIEFHPLFDITVAGAHPVRLVVNGAESQPFWIIL